MSQTKAKAKQKRRSQAPIALVYFVTMLVFMFVIGLGAMYALKEFNILGGDDSNSDDGIKSPVYNTLFARVNSKGVLADAAVIRVAPDAKQVVVIPISAFTVDDKGSTFREVLEEGGMVKLEKTVSDTFGIEVDNYLSLTNDAFESAADIVGGITYAPEEELYYLSQDNDENDIAIPSGELTTLSGHQIRLICQYPVFKEGRNGNLKFLGTALQTLINNAFQQVNITKDNLDNFYNIFTENSDTNWTSEDFKDEKIYIKNMLEQNLTPCTAFVPTGEWTDDSHFKISDEYKESIQTMLKETAPSAAVEESE